MAHRQGKAWLFKAPFQCNARQATRKGNERQGKARRVKAPRGDTARQGKAARPGT
jgi:hypothetical protein